MRTPPYTDAMRSVADTLRGRTADRIRAMDVRERIALALRLGDEDVERFAQSRGLDPADARRQLARSRRRGRAASQSADRR